MGGITVDSIRLEAGVCRGAALRRGQKLGKFALGGSSIALFYNRDVRLPRKYREIRTRHKMDFKVQCGQDLVDLASDAKGEQTI